MMSTYRPFHRRWVEAGRRLNAMVYQLPRVFPPGRQNLAILVSNQGARTPFSVLAVKDLPDLNVWIDPTPAFPMYVYQAGDTEDSPASLFDGREGSDAHPEHNVSGHVLGLYRTLDSAIDKDDIFFYVYGVLHSRDYRTAFGADLKKSLPRIPQVRTAADFWTFAGAGRELAELHTEYEGVDPWPALRHAMAPGFDSEHADAYRVLKMKHPKVIDPATGKKVEDRTRIIYNEWITIEDVPERAYEYELGSRSAIAWVMEAWRVRTDKASGIVNDPNNWATEQDDPTYILDLVGRVVAVSMRTLEIIDELPVLDL